jgi:hypothetical protein
VNQATARRRYTARDQGNNRENPTRSVKIPGVNNSAPAMRAGQQRTCDTGYDNQRQGELPAGRFSQLQQQSQLDKGYDDEQEEEFQ